MDNLFWNVMIEEEKSILKNYIDIYKIKSDINKTGFVCLRQTEI